MKGRLVLVLVLPELIPFKAIRLVLCARLEGTAIPLVAHLPVCANLVCQASTCLYQEPTLQPCAVLALPVLILAQATQCVHCVLLGDIVMEQPPRMPLLACHRV